MKKPLIVIFAILFFWILFDMYIPRKSDLKEFDPLEISRLDCGMWRSYYEKRPIALFKQSAELMRIQLKAPFWRSFIIAYYPAKAAFVFKGGKNRIEYANALPFLEKYYYYVNELSSVPFDIKYAARQELEWWIVRRERDIHPLQEWADLQAKVASEIYQKPPILFYEYGKRRTEAMFFRDEKGENITENDWINIRKKLDEAWSSLYKSVNKK